MWCCRKNKQKSFRQSSMEKNNLLEEKTSEVTAILTKSDINKGLEDLKGSSTFIQRLEKEVLLGTISLLRYSS